jgi:hypothetical protein
MSSLDMGTQIVFSVEELMTTKYRTQVGTSRYVGIFHVPQKIRLPVKRSFIFTALPITSHNERLGRAI